MITKIIGFGGVLCLALSFVAGPAWADVLWGVQITKLYAQSRLESNAHLIKINRTLSSVCNGDRLYIDIADKELFATALARHLDGKPVDLIFVTNASPKTAAGHVDNIPCKVLSIF